jgi:hypothetical protein
MSVKFSVVVECDESGCGATAVGQVHASVKREDTCSDGCCYSTEFALDMDNLEVPEGWYSGHIIRCPKHYQEWRNQYLDPKP